MGRRWIPRHWVTTHVATMRPTEPFGRLVRLEAERLVEGKAIVELKLVEQISKSHRKQAALMKEGIVRAVNGLEENLPRQDVGAQRDSEESN